jgi:hypothetical protein
MNQFSSLLAAGAVLAAGANRAGAQTTEGPITTTTPIGFTLTDFNGNLLFPEFNPALGTLDSVTLDFTSSMSTCLTIQNQASSTSLGSVFTQLQITVEDKGNNFAATDPEIVFNSPAFHYSLAPGQSLSSGLLTATGTSANTYTAAAILAEFTGSGNLSLNASSSSWTVQANSGGNTAASQVTFANLTGTVEYTYTDPPAPVPDASSTAGLLTLGFGAMSLLRRRFK